MELQDELVTLPHNEYWRYLIRVYGAMTEHIPPNSHLIEIGTRHDRGVLSKEILPYSKFETVDKNPKRAGRSVDVRNVKISADVILSTCLLHHTAEEEIPSMLRNLDAPILLFSGPSKEALPGLFGDHKWHIETHKLIDWLHNIGYRNFTVDKIGMSEPYCEVFVAAKK